MIGSRSIVIMTVLCVKRVWKFHLHTTLHTVFYFTLTHVINLLCIQFKQTYNCSSSLVQYNQVYYHYHNKVGHIWNWRRWKNLKSSLTTNTKVQEGPEFNLFCIPFILRFSNNGSVILSILFYLEWHFTAGYMGSHLVVAHIPMEI